MLEKGERTKQKVVEAALLLFNAKGYSGTSIRAIADRAGVNMALISYYFGSKHGLMEKLMVDFFEEYTKITEIAFLQLSRKSAKQCLLTMIKSLLTYQQQHCQLARFVHREITLDSTLVREVMMTYFMKEKYFVKKVVETGIEQRQFCNASSDLMAIQVRALVTLPYSQPQYIREVYHLLVNEDYFVEKYYKHIEKWIEQFLTKEVMSSMVVK